MNQEYSIVWKSFSSTSDVGHRLKTSNDFALPYFIDGKDKQKFEDSDLDKLSEFHLLRGILVSYFDAPPTIDTNIFKSVAKNILNDLKDYFKIESIERLILSTAAFLRSENGYDVCFKALSAGLEICPTSSKIKFDSCTVLYNQLTNEEIDDKDWGKRKLQLLLNEIDLNEINPDFIKHYRKYKDYVSSNEETPPIIKVFESQINSYEEHLFGMTLYYETAPKIMRWTQKSSYNKIKGRIQQSLSEAKKLLRQVKSGSKPPKQLKIFNWPLRWKPMEDRIELLLNAYKIMFFDRPMKPLTKSELKILRKTVKELI